MSLTLHSYWRSGAAWRVRIALALKGIAFETVAHDLRIGAQNDPAYLALNRQGLVPAIETGGETLTQSLAILEWLEEFCPETPLLPADPIARATVRAMAQIIACDIHPLNNLRVLNALRQDLGADEAQVRAWIARWIGAGFTALEQMIGQHGGQFAFGDSPTMADCCLIPQVYSAIRFGVDLQEFPRIVEIDAHSARRPAFMAAAPKQQPDFG